MKITSGDRIRLVTAAVDFDNGQTVTVNLRYRWDGARPSHQCRPDECGTCLDWAELLAARRAAAGSVVRDTWIRRDRQTVAR